MAAGDAHVFPGFLTPVPTHFFFFFLKPPNTFLTCFRGERRKYAGKTVRLNRVSNSQPPDNGPDTLTTEPPGRAHFMTNFATYTTYIRHHTVNYSFKSVTETVTWKGKIVIRYPVKIAFTCHC